MYDALKHWLLVYYRTVATGASHGVARRAAIDAVPGCHVTTDGAEKAIKLEETYRAQIDPTVSPYVAAAAARAKSIE